MATVRCNVTQCPYNRSQFCEKLTIFVCGGGCSEMNGSRKADYIKQTPQPDVNDLYAFEEYDGEEDEDDDAEIESMNS